MVAKHGLVRRNRGKGHSYTLDGSPVEGVTTLLKGGLPKPGLIAWTGKVVAEWVADAEEEELLRLRRMGRNAMVAALKELPWEKRDAAAAKGTTVHRKAELIAKGEEVEVEPAIEGYVEACVEFLHDWQIGDIALEASVASRRWRYAGTVDLIADARRPDSGHAVRAIFDYKTSASGIWSDVALQLAPYRWAEFAVIDGHETPMEQLQLDQVAYAVWLRPDGTYDVYPVQVHEGVFKAFCHVAYVARVIDRDKGQLEGWLGQPIYPTGEHDGQR